MCISCVIVKAGWMHGTRAPPPPTDLNFSVARVWGVNIQSRIYADNPGHAVVHTVDLLSSLSALLPCSLSCSLCSVRLAPKASQVWGGGTHPDLFSAPLFPPAVPPFHPPSLLLHFFPLSLSPSLTPGCAIFSGIRTMSGARRIQVLQQQLQRHGGGGGLTVHRTAGE